MRACSHRVFLLGKRHPGVPATRNSTAAVRAAAIGWSLTIGHLPEPIRYRLEQKGMRRRVTQRHVVCGMGSSGSVGGRVAKSERTLTWPGADLPGLPERIPLWRLMVCSSRIHEQG